MRKISSLMMAAGIACWAGGAVTCHGSMPAAAAGPATDSAGTTLTPELLEVPPVEALNTAPMPDYPIAVSPTPVSVPAPSAETSPSSIASNFGRENILLPYYISAYVPPVENTEIDLGLLLSSTPGIEVALGWGAMDRLLVTVKMSALGASNSAALGFRYLLLPETPESSKPALAATVHGLYLDQRTLGDVRETIFRGNRIQAGLALTKDLGALGRSLQAGEGLIAALKIFRINAEALIEIQTGVVGAQENRLQQGGVGARASLEAVLNPGVLYAYGVLDTIPDWRNEENYYLGVRYFAQADLAFDVLIGRIENGTSLVLGVAWIF